VTRAPRFPVAWAAIAFAAALATPALSQTSGEGTPPALAAGEGRIYFYRETWHALSVQPDVTVNGEVVGKALPNVYFFVDRKPGTYEIATIAEPERKITLTLGNGETRYMSLEFTVSWFLVAHINPVPVDSAVGAHDMAGLHYMNGADTRR
jgi:Protein of unknown function (DUF2846)